MRTRDIICSLLLVVHAAPAIACRQNVAEGDGYSFPIPAGWIQVGAEVALPAGTLAFRQPEKTAPDFMVASLVVMPVPSTGSPFDPTDAGLCAQIAEQLAKQVGAKPTGAAIVDGPTGKTCQTDILSPDGSQAARGTYLKLSSGAWMATCNRDPRDSAATASCEEALRGFKAR